MKILQIPVAILAFGIGALCQVHAPPVPANQARKAGMTNIGEVMLPLPIGAQYNAAIDPIAGFGYFGSSHHPAISKIDLRGPVPKLVASPKEVGAIGSILVDTSDPDPMKHYLYVAQRTTVPEILKMSPGDDTHGPDVIAVLRPTSVTGGLGVGLIDTGNPDPALHYAYFGVVVAKQPPQVLRVRLSDFSDQGAETLQMDNLRYGAIDTVRHYGYFTSSASFKPNEVPQICKVNLTAFHDGGKSVATYRMNSTTPGDGITRDGFNYPIIDVGLVIDEAHGYAYFGTSNYDRTPGESQIDRWPQNQSLVVRVKLGDGDAFPDHPLQTLDLRPGERNLSPAVFDAARGNIYFGTDNTYPAYVYMIHAGDGSKPMKEVARLDLNPGSIPKEGLPHDGDTVPGAKAALYGEVFLRSAILDAKRNAIYFGTDSIPAQIVKIGINGKK